MGQRSAAPVPGHQVVLPCLLALVLAACSGGGDGGGGADGDDGPTVVATTSVLGDVVGNVVGDDGEVEVLLPRDADPHAYEPSARDVAALAEADLVVANGLGLEEGLLDTLAATADDGVAVLELAPELDPLPADDDEHAAHGDEHAAAGDAEHAGAWDPHVWHDPIRMAAGAERVGDELAAVAGPGEGGPWRRRAADYADEVREAHAAAEDLLAAVPDDRRRLVTSHDAFGYLAARYDLEVVGTVVSGSAADAEPDARAFAELIETLDAAGVDAVFSENVAGDRLSERLATEAGERGGREIRVVELFSDALGAEGGPAGTYVGMVRENARRIAEALA